MLKEFMTRPPRPSLLWPGRPACAKPAPTEVAFSALQETVS
jgi:hypothetical protein